MIELRELEEKEASAFFINDPQLCYRSLSDNELLLMYNNKKWTKPEKSDIIGVFVNKQLILILRYEYFTPIAITIHPYLASEFRGSGMFTEVQELLKRWTKKNLPHVKKIIAMHPTSCPWVGKVCKKFGFKIEGCFRDSVMWRNKLNDLYLYGLSIEDK